MIGAGIKLSLLGMTVVFCFLLLLVLFIKVSYWFLSAGSARELAEMETAELKRKQRSPERQGDDVLVAVISAAIAAQRARIRLVG